MTSGPNRAARPVIPVDYEDLKSGFQSGKAAALADWAFRKEQAEFVKVVNRLRVRKWAKENPEKRRAIANRYARKPGVSDRTTLLSKRRRHERHRKAGKVIVCAECRAAFCEVKPRRGLPRRFCTANCDARFRYHAKHPNAARRLRMSEP